MTVHIEGARGWLERAAREWGKGCRARALLDLSLAEAEVRLARYAASTEPLPARRKTSGVAVALAAAALAVSLAGSLRGPTSTTPPRFAEHAATRTVSLGYTPGGVLALVAPPREGPGGLLEKASGGRAWGPQKSLRDFWGGLGSDPWAGSREEDSRWLRALLREAGVQGEDVPVAPVSFR